MASVSHKTYFPRRLVEEEGLPLLLKYWNSKLSPVSLISERKLFQNKGDITETKLLGWFPPLLMQLTHQASMPFWSWIQMGLRRSTDLIYRELTSFHRCQLLQMSVLKKFLINSLLLPDEILPTSIHARVNIMC